MSEPMMIEYDEFGLFGENITEFELAVDQTPTVERVAVDVAHDPGRGISALRWGSGEPEIVFVHGGAQNAHTWDTVALALGRPALAIDLPGHGHSDWRADGVYSPPNLADDVAGVVGDLAPAARLVVGMSLGGLTCMELAAHHRLLVKSLVMVDITPGVNQHKAKAVIDFVNGPQEFASFEDLLARTIEHNPTRSESSLRRGILHNAKQAADGSWQWRYDRSSHARSRPEDATETGGVMDAPDAASSSTGPLWNDLESITCPITLLRGSASPVVDDDDVAEARRRQPDIDVRVVVGAGHSIQGDRPIELAEILAELLL